MERPKVGHRVCLGLSVLWVDAVRVLGEPPLSHPTPRGMGAMIQCEQRDDRV